MSGPPLELLALMYGVGGISRAPVVDIGAGILPGNHVHRGLRYARDAGVVVGYQLVAPGRQFGDRKREFARRQDNGIPEARAFVESHHRYPVAAWLTVN